MSTGAIIAVLVAIESVLVLAAVRWLVQGLRTTESQERPPIMPIGPVAGSLPIPRDRDEKIAATS